MSIRIYSSDMYRYKSINKRPLDKENTELLKEKNTLQ